MDTIGKLTTKKKITHLTQKQQSNTTLEILVHTDYIFLILMVKLSRNFK